MFFALTPPRHADHDHAIAKLDAGGFLWVEATDGTCMVDVPNWDFNWQGAFFYETPIDLANNTFRLDCTYNTMERDSVVTWGDGTLDEMCLSFFYVTSQ